jgi:tripartite-type tricarboxylate transporter receptor subunit TctC
VLRWLVVLLCLLCGPSLAAYPDRSIRFVIPSAPGGSPEQFLALVRSETPKRAAVVKRSGAKVG